MSHALSVTKNPVACVICTNSEGWINVDEYRLKADGMSMCPKCGFITYPQIVDKSEELKEFYRQQYRPAPTIQNVFTGQRKLHYHAHFLDDLFIEWKKKGKKPDVFEVGSAFGMFLKMIMDTFPGASVAGSELTLAFRRVAFHEYGIRLSEEFDDTRKYDLIASYKVAEHIPFIDKELRRYALALKEGGYLYVSVPTWFHTMSNFGVDGFSLDYYYDKNHVNVWTRKLFETLLRRCGLEIVKKDTVYYDSTYLCRRNDEVMKVSPEYEETEKIIDSLSRIKKASHSFDDGKFDEALSHFPAFPDAHIANYEKNRAAWHQRGFEAIEKEVMAPARKACPENVKVTFFCADLCMRYGQVEKAMEYLIISIRQKPEDPGSLMAIGHAFRELAQRAKLPEEQAKYYQEARDVMRHLRQSSLQHSLDAVTWIYADNAKIAMPDETTTK